jgi:hypothetical protein
MALVSACMRRSIGRVVSSRIFTSNRLGSELETTMSGRRKEGRTHSGGHGAVSAKRTGHSQERKRSTGRAKPEEGNAEVVSDNWE